jgi:hypothetical protein
MILVPSLAPTSLKSTRSGEFQRSAHSTVSSIPCFSFSLIDPRFMDFSDEYVPKFRVEVRRSRRAKVGAVMEPTKSQSQAHCSTATALKGGVNLDPLQRLDVKWTSSKLLSCLGPLT